MTNSFLTGFVGFQIRGTSSVYQQKEYKGVIKKIQFSVQNFSFIDYVYENC